ncbi:rRNA methyltransferase [Vallitalea longa]|uniref:rRNA methyltransferase n=1 Tax=Vallitalea longa TaxID=2936439 RepID=A0A9W6DF32_9FIRM|nr:class I SAM-dependent methyltransferase [Vallitalea longa]GKX30150.1 rRNA methyltransferase [Vallitalea longa]
MFETRITDTVQGIVKDYIDKGDTVIDATIGNGNDTAFLAENVGDNGKVIGFDVQQLAIRTTKEKLNERNLLNRVTLIEDSHENVKNYVDSPIKVAMFNLGYLPKGDKKIITKPESTIKAINDILELLKSNGVVSIISYYGHEGGLLEKNKVCEYLGALSNKKFDVISIAYENRKMNAPIIYLIRKK